MKKVVYSVSKINRFGNNRMTGIGFITHEYTEFGELYDFLIVTDYPKEWDDLVYSQGSYHTAFAYVWNKDDDQCSEFGSVTVRSFGGGIARVA